MIYIKTIINGKINIDGNVYFLIEHKKKWFAILDKCPHRGGPLSLGEKCSKMETIQCPWHNNIFKVCSLIKKSLAGLRIQNKAIFPIYPEKSS